MPANPRKVSQNLIYFYTRSNIQEGKQILLQFFTFFSLSIPCVLFSIHWIAATRKWLFLFLQLMIKIDSTRKLAEEDPSWKTKGRLMPPFNFSQGFDNSWWTNHNCLAYPTLSSGEKCQMYFFHSKTAQLVFHLAHLLGTSKSICVFVSRTGEPKGF